MTNVINLIFTNRRTKIPTPRVVEDWSLAQAKALQRPARAKISDINFIDYEVSEKWCRKCTGASFGMLNKADIIRFVDEIINGLEDYGVEDTLIFDNIDLSWFDRRVWNELIKKLLARGYKVCYPLLFGDGVEAQIIMY